MHAAGCDAAGARLMSQDECKAAAGRQGRKWLGASRNDAEAPGCVMWEEGNVEYNSAKPRLERPNAMCVARACARRRLAVSCRLLA